MKALVYHGNKDLRVEEVLEPETQQGQVKLAVDFCGICATDIEEYLYGPVFISGDAPNPVTGKMMPLVTGHEITGTVIEIAPGVSNISIGDRVALNGILTCENRDQAWVRAARDQGNKGRAAAQTCLAMLDLRRRFESP